MDNLKRVRTVITKWELNKSLLAEKIGMPKTTCSYTIKGKLHYRFSPEQFEKLTNILVKIGDDLKTIR